MWRVLSALQEAYDEGLETGQEGHTARGSDLLEQIIGSIRSDLGMRGRAN